jgi:long-subunit fatty acid transport protein
MIASRLWYLVLGITIGFLTFMLFIAASMFDRASKRTMSEGLAGDAQVVTWFIKDDARKRSSALINFALDPELSSALVKSSASTEKLPNESREKLKKLLKTVNDKLGDASFTALFAVDQSGRVVAFHGFDQATGIDDFELGGYPVVADALHGWVRDDSWVLDGRIYRVVARPVESDASQPPAGAIVGARIIDDSYAKDLSKRTSAAVAFFANNTRVASAAPEGFDPGQLDAITADLASLKDDKEYHEKGRSEVRVLRENLGVVYSLIPGESWELGAGFAVGRAASLVGTPQGFLAKSDDNDKKAASIPIVAGVSALAALLGLLFSFLEHTKPLNTFRSEAARMAKGEADQLQPSKFLGVYRKIASDINDGIEKIAAKGGGSRKAADLEQVLGPIPAQPAMSAFSFPGLSSSGPPSGDPKPEMSGSFTPELSGSFDALLASSPSGPAKGPPRKPGPPPPTNKPASQREEEPEATVVSKVPQDLLAASAAHPAADDDTAEWPKVFDEFVRVKKSNGESVEGLTFEKFKNTLRKNRDTLVATHGCKRVKFTVYVKEGRAALKASPVKELAFDWLAAVATHQRVAARLRVRSCIKGRRQPVTGRCHTLCSARCARGARASPARRGRKGSGMRKASFKLGSMLTAAAAATALLSPSSAHANGFEFPSNGSEQFARGSAWLARATDPVAVFYNPAALSRNGTAVSVTANITFQKACFERRDGGGDATANAVQVGATGTQELYGRACNDAAPFINPQLAFQYRLTDKLGVGIAVLGPSAVGKTDYPLTTTNTSLGNKTAGQDVDGPSAARYIITKQDAKIIWPQLAVGYEIAPKLRIGASFIWGIALIKFSNVSMGLSSNQTKDVTTGRIIESGDQDLSADVSVKDLFIPGFSTSAMYTLGDNIDIAGWFHWSDSVKAKGDAQISAFVYEPKLTPYANPQVTNTPKDQTSVTVPQPWDLRLGVRYYMPRVDVVLTEKGGLLKDPLRDEVFDVEVDLQYSHDSSFDTLGIQFGGAETPISDPRSGAALGSVPRDAGVPHNWKDSYGVRLGGDVAVIPGTLAVRGGGFFQSSSIDPKYLHLDFVAAQRIGLTVGATFRAGPVDLQAGYGHIFFKTLDNNGEGAVAALTGSADKGNRSPFPVNGGKITASADVITLGIVPRF